MKADFSIQSSRNILIPRFDTFGDLVLVEGLVSSILEMCPEASVTMLVRKGYDQLAPMFPGRLQWKTTSLNPFGQAPRREELAPFLTSLRENSYDLVLFTTYSRTWLDDAVATATAPARRVVLGVNDGIPYHPDSIPEQSGAYGPSPAYDTFVEVEERVHETEKYRVLLERLTVEPQPLWPPQLVLAGELQESAARVLAERGLREGEYFVCAPAGTANISIKAWPQTGFARIIARIEQAFGVPALLTGHETERSIVENVFRLAEQEGAHPRTWLGRDGEMPLAAALAQKSLFYLGNDTGLMHVAAAFERPVIAFFGGGHWPRFLPIARAGRVFVTPMPCFYCKWECVFDEALCVRGIALQEALPEIDEFLKELRDGRQSFRVIEQKVRTADLPEFFEQSVRRLDLMKKDAQAERISFLDQTKELNRLLHESEIDRNARLDQIMELTRILHESQEDRNARFDQIVELTRLLGESERESNDRLEQLARLTRLVDAARDIFSVIKSSRIYRMARTMGLFDELERLISDFQDRPK